MTDSEEDEEEEMEEAEAEEDADAEVDDDVAKLIDGEAEVSENEDCGNIVSEEENDDVDEGFESQSTKERELTEENEKSDTHQSEVESQKSQEKDDFEVNESESQDQREGNISLFLDLPDAQASLGSSCPM